MNVRCAFWILFFLNLFNYLDRQVLFSVFPLIQTELGMSDFQLGLLASVFMLVYMCYAPVAGFFADRHPRQYWIAASALVWSGATFCSGLAKNYIALLGARAFTGIGEGGFTTIAQPFLAEQYPKQHRATVLAYFSLALPAGAALGYWAGGFIGGTWGWRAAFMLAGIPGILLAGLALKYIKDKEHRHVENRKKPGLRQYLSLLANASFLFLCLAHAMQTFAMGGLSAWMPTYFLRFFNMSAAQAGAVFGGMVIIAGAAGTYLGGKLADKLLEKTNYAYFIVILASFLLCLIFGAAGVISRRTPFALITFSIAIIFMFLPLAPISAALVALSGRKVRSMAFAVNIFIIHALGDAISPALVGHVSDLFGLKIAVLGCLSMLLPGMLFIYFSSKQARAEGRLIQYYNEELAEG